MSVFFFETATLTPSFRGNTIFIYIYIFIAFSISGRGDPTAFEKKVNFGKFDLSSCK